MRRRRREHSSTYLLTHTAFWCRHPVQPVETCQQAVGVPRTKCSRHTSSSITTAESHVALLVFCALAVCFGHEHTTSQLHLVPRCRCYRQCVSTTRRNVQNSYVETIETAMYVDMRQYASQPGPGCLQNQLPLACSVQQLHQGRTPGAASECRATLCKALTCVYAQRIAAAATAAASSPRT